MITTSRLQVTGVTGGPLRITGATLVNGAYELATAGGADYELQTERQTIMDNILFIPGIAQEIRTLRYGVASPSDQTFESAINITWFPLLPCHQKGKLTQVRGFWKSSGNYKIKVARFNGVTWDEAWTSDTLVGNGDSTVDLSANNIDILPGDIVGFEAGTARLAAIRNAGGDVGGGVMFAYKLGAFSGTNQTLILSTALTDMYTWQFSYTVEGEVKNRPTIFDQSFANSVLPWDWRHNSTAWVYSSGKAVSGAAGVANRLEFQFPIGNLSNWTWTTDFQFDTTGSAALFTTSNYVNGTNGFAFEIDSTTGNLVLYRTSTSDGWTGGALNAADTQATGISFATGTTYQISISKSFRAASISITNTESPSETFTYGWSQEDATVSANMLRGYGYGRPGFSASSGTISVSRSRFVLPTSKPKWLFIGDSITEGTGVTTTLNTYARRTGLSLFTSANGGAATSHVTQRLGAEQVFICPENFHFLIGTNDTVSATWITRMNHFYDRLTGTAKKVIIGCVPAEAADPNPEDNFNPHIISEGWPTVRYDLALSTDGTGAGRIGALYFDTLHPNNAGHEAMYQRFITDQG
jgi:hypothetical protein